MGGIVTAANRDQGPGRVGQVKEVSSVANPLIKDIRGLALKKNRDRSGTFLADGLKLVIDALELGWHIRTLIYARPARDKKEVETVAARTVAAGGLVLEVSEKVLGAINRRDNPQMVCGIFDRRTRQLADLRPQSGETYVALDRVRDPGNLGTIIRTADAAGASGLILIGESTEAFSLETVRATMGSVFTVPVAKTGPAGFLAWHAATDALLVGTHLAGAVDYRTIDYATRPTVLLMGSEQARLPEELDAACDALALIPQAGRADSLNLAVATGIMLFEARRPYLELSP